MSELAQETGILGEVREKEFVDGLHDGLELPHAGGCEPVATKGVDAKRKEGRHGVVPRAEHLVEELPGFAGKERVLGVVGRERRGSGGGR